MSLMEMSLSGAVMILAIAALRSFTVNRLPKGTFSLLWMVALVRLLVPYSLPSVYSVYSMVNRLPAAQDAALPLPPVLFSPTLPAAPQPMTGSPAPAVAQPVNWWAVLWLAGTAVCVLWFALCYVRCRREFRMSLPVRNAFVRHWLRTHKLRRGIEIRQSAHIAAPLTYGVLRPVILVPKGTDWTDSRTLRYVLEHEYNHIRRFDAAAKLLFTAALCLHWFNPAVWLMYFLANRDMELSCDEAVIRLFGQGVRSNYAMTLIHMEETKGGYLPLANGFSKNAIEERIKAIMKTKKITLWVSLIALILVISVAILFATSPKQTPNAETSHVPETTAAATEASSVRLLDGLTMELPASITRQTVSETRDEFLRDGQVIGGIVEIDLTQDLLTYLQTNIIEGLSPADYDYNMSGSADGCAAVIETGTRDRFFTHYIYQGYTAFYDVWFEDPLSNTGQVQQIIASVRSADIPEYSPSSGSNAEAVERIAFDNYSLPQGSWAHEDLQALRTAIEEDTAAGTMIPDGPHAQFHFEDGTYAIFDEGVHDASYILLTLESQGNALTYTIFPECEHIMAWMEAHGIPQELSYSVVENSWDISFTPVLADSGRLTLNATRTSGHACELQLEQCILTGGSLAGETRLYNTEELQLDHTGTADVSIDWSEQLGQLPAGDYEMQFILGPYPSDSTKYQSSTVAFTIG